MTAPDAPATDGAPDTDLSHLTVTEELAIQVLASRAREGHASWTFEARMSAVLNRLARKGLIGVKSGSHQGTRLAWLTDEGQRYAHDPGYLSPRERLAAEMVENIDAGFSLTWVREQLWLQTREGAEAYISRQFQRRTDASAAEPAANAPERNGAGT